MSNPPVDLLGGLMPYYAGPMATLYLGDCRDVAPLLPSRSVDLVIADPPYGIGWRSNWRAETFDSMAGDDGLTDWPVVLGNIVKHVLNLRRHVYVFGYEPDQLIKPLQLSTAVPLVWDRGKHGAGNLAIPYGPSHEMLTFGIMAPRPFRTGGGQGGLAARLRQGSIVRAGCVNGGAVTRHPSEKTVRGLRQLVESSSCLGETVFDPTAGVASSGVAALLAGRRWVGIELELKYADIAVKRLRAAEHLAQQAEAV